MALIKSSKLMFMVVFIAAVFLLSSQLAFTAPHDFVLNPMLGHKLLQSPPLRGYAVPKGGGGSYPCCNYPPGPPHQ